MAIIFVSPIKKRSIAMWIAFAVFLLAIALVAVITFLPELKKKLNVAQPQAVLAIPEVKINFSVIDSERVKSLDSFSAIATEFEYVGKDSNAKEVTGTVIAESIADAVAKLQAINVTVASIQPLTSGRVNPFASYYKGTGNKR